MNCEMIAITLFLIIFMLIPFHFRLEVGDILAPDYTNIIRIIFSDLLRIVISRLTSYKCQDIVSMVKCGKPCLSISTNLTNTFPTPDTVNTMAKYSI